ncbi:hypothetical protein AZE42_05706 [Rhizopogon vesiculosus]|uniref:Uncharacterized protein n=1 Tax=Rhizopogon vesiculosus TaxID=180088 RepID=A0A1J8PQ33_9AGAM|nr:hypothetical protein AZE42_05706 [Rhizopogon vesiculosus]
MTSPNSFYTPPTDQEGIFTHLSGEHEDFQDFSQIQSHTPITHDHLYESPEVANSYDYAFQPHAPHLDYPPAGGAPPNPSYPGIDFRELPFYDMDTGSYLDQSPFGLQLVMPGPEAQHFQPDYIVPQPFTEPHPQPMHATTLPASPMELTDLMTSDFRSSPRHSPMATSRISGPSTPLNTSGVTQYSHSPTTPLNRTSQSPGFAGPGSVTGTGSRQTPISPLQKRPFESSADDDSLVCSALHFPLNAVVESIVQDGRRIIPRHSGASNVHSATSGGTDTTIPSITSRVPGRGRTIPQSAYNVGNTHAFHFSPNNGMVVAFDVAGETGIPLHQLLERQSVLLQGRHERISDMSGDTASIRIEWPGYPSFTKQIASKDWKKKRSPNTREKLATKVADAVCTFFQKHANTSCDPPNSIWRIGPNGIRIEDLVLVSLHRVSQGSWQPKLCLLRENAQQ